ncbi:MAG: CHAT domain-containing protein, partial [Bacteroidota bacterium]
LSLTASVGGFLKLENRHYQRAIDLALRLYRERDDKEYLAEAFRFASVQKANLLRRYLGVQELAQSFGVPQEVVGEKVRLETDVLVLEKALAEASADERPSLRQELLGKQQELSEVRRKLESDHPTFSRALRGAALADPFAAAAGLTPDRMVIEYFLGQDSIYQFALSKEAGLTYAVVPRPENLKDLTQRALSDTATAATTCYQRLVAPLLEQEPGISRLQFIPDGMLWNVNFQSLRNNSQYLIQQQAVSYAYSSGMLFATDGAANNKANYLGFGISYDEVIDRINSAKNRSGTDNRLRNMGSLPYARQDVEEVAALLGTNPVLEDQATKANFLTQAPDGGILHLAMHGILEENPMESSLVFRGEQPGTYELLRMRELLGRQFPASLTVLSACHSGNGPLEATEGRQSIGRAFAAAGSKATITSAWAAPDRATYAIMKQVFQYIDEELPTDQALQRATISYLEESSAAERDPINWAHLNLTGSVMPVKAGSSWQWGLLAMGLIGLLASGLWFWGKK